MAQKALNLKLNGIFKLKNVTTSAITNFDYLISGEHFDEIKSKNKYNNSTGRPQT